MDVENTIQALRDSLGANRRRLTEPLPREPDGHRMNMSERYLFSVLKRIDPGSWSYTGDGTLSIGRMKPDFTCNNGRRAVIELFGNAWHSIEEASRRIQDFKALGYDCLVVWGEQLEGDEDDLIDHIVNWRSYQPKNSVGMNIPRPVDAVELKDRIPLW